MKTKGFYYSLNSRQEFYFTLGLISFFLLQITAIAYCNLIRLPYLLDYDSAPILKHAMTIIEQNRIFLTNFQYPSTLELDSPLFIAVLLYSFTKNMCVSFGLASIICTLIFIFIVNSILKKLNIELPIRLLVLIILLTPFSIGQVEYFNMLFLGTAQYIVKIIIGLEFLNLVIKSEQNRRLDSIVNVIELIIFLAALFLSSVSSGIYLCISVLIPTLAYFVLLSIRENKIYMHKSLFIILFSSFLISLSGYLTFKVLGFSSKADGILLIQASDFTKNIGMCIEGFLLLFAALPNHDIKVISPQGILHLSRFAFVILVLIAIAYELIKGYKQKSHIIKFSTGLCGILVCINFSILFLTDTRYGASVFESRYHLFSLMFIIIIFAIFLNELWKMFHLIKPTFIIFILICLLMTNIFNYRELFKTDIGSAQLLSIKDRVTISAPETILILIDDESVFSLQESRILQAYDLSREYVYIQPKNIDDYSNGYIIDLFNRELKYTQNSAYGGKNLLITTEVCWKKLPEAIRIAYIPISNDETFLYFITDNCPFFN